MVPAQVSLGIFDKREQNWPPSRRNLLSRIEPVSLARLDLVEKIIVYTSPFCAHAELYSTTPRLPKVLTFLFVASLFDIRNWKAIELLHVLVVAGIYIKPMCKTKRPQ